MRIRVIAVLTVSAVLLGGCHSLTEWEGTLKASVVFIRTDDHTVEYVMGGFDDGRAILSIDSRTFYVMGSTGTLYKVDSEEMAVDTSFSLWNGSSLGPVDMISPHPRSKLYIIGNGPDIIEVGVSSNQVTDIFSAGPHPACIVSSRSVTNPSFYVGDSQDNRLRQVDTSNNVVLRNKDIGYCPYAMGIDITSELLLVSAFFDEVIRMMNIALDPIHAGQVVEIHGTDIEVPAGYEGFFMVDPRWESGSGRLYTVKMDTLGGLNTSSFPMPGHPVRLTSTPNGRFLYVLSNTGSGGAVLSVFDLFSSPFDLTIELDGYPWDMTTHGNGEYVLVLMAN